VEAVLETWLAQQCETIPGVERGLLLLRPEEPGAPIQSMTWPARTQVGPGLGAAARAAVAQGGVVIEDAHGQARIAVPLRASGRSGVVAVEIADCPKSEIQNALDHLRRGVGWLGAMGRGEADKNLLLRVIELVQISLEHDRFRDAATAVATEMATRLGCDRVSIGFVEGGRMTVKALSHSASFDARSNLIRDLGLAMEEAADQDATIAYPAPSGATPRIERAHEQLRRLYGSGSVWTVPVARCGQMIGAFSFERTRIEPVDPGTIRLCEDAAGLLGPILQMKRGTDARLLERWRDSLRIHREKLFGPDHPTHKLVAVGGALLFLFLAFAKIDYRIAAEATLEGRIQRVVVAGIEGYIAEAKVRAGDVVRRGQILGRLDDRDLVLEHKKWTANHEQVRREYREALAGHDRTQASILSAKMSQAEAQLQLIAENLERTRLIAPFDGIVVKGDLSQMLGSPVSRGDILFEMAPLEGYRIILKVDEREIADVVTGAPGELALSAMPGRPLPLTVERVTPVSVAEEGRNYFRVEASLQGETRALRPGMEGVAKIHAGRRTLVWIWTHELIDWFRLWLWSFWP